MGRIFVRIGRCPAPVTKPGVKSEQGICRCALVCVEALQGDRAVFVRLTLALVVRKMGRRVLRLNVQTT